MFARIGRLFRGFLGLFISGIEEANPEALMEAARTEFRSKMTQYNLALARMAGVAERLKGQVKMKADRAQELERLEPALGHILARYASVISAGVTLKSIRAKPIAIANEKINCPRVISVCTSPSGASGSWAA